MLSKPPPAVPVYGAMTIYDEKTHERVPIVAAVPLGATTVLTPNTAHDVELSAPRDFTFSETLTANDKIILRIKATAPVAITFPACIRTGTGTNSPQTSLPDGVPIGTWLLVFHSNGTETLLTDTVGIDDPLATDAEIVAGTGTVPLRISAAQAKLAAQTFGAGTPPANLTQVQAEDPEGTDFGLVSGERLAQAINARIAGELEDSQLYPRQTTLWPTADLDELPDDLLIAGQHGTPAETPLTNRTFVVKSYGNVVAPSFSVIEGEVASGTPLELDTITPDAEIRYTTGDGSQDAPTRDTGTVYTTPINITSGQTIKAIAYRDGWKDSAVVEASYTIASTYPLAGVSGVFLAFSASRYLRSEVEGDPVVQLREDAGNTTKDFKIVGGVLVTDDVNEDTVSEWLTANSATNAYVAIWYDQSGNGRNFRQTTTSRQPLLQSGWNSRQVVRNPTGNTRYLTSTSSITAPDPASGLEVYIVCDSEESNSSQIFLTSTGSTVWYQGMTNNRPRYHADDVSILNSSNAISGKVLLSYLRGASASSVSTVIRKNAVDDVTGNTVADIRNGTWGMFATNTGTINANSSIGELIMLSGVSDSTQRTQIEASAMSHFSL